MTDPFPKPVAVDYAGTEFYDGLALEADHFHKEWELQHRVLTRSLGLLLSDGGLLYNPNRPEPLVTSGVDWVLKAEARILMPGGVVLVVEEDAEFKAGPGDRVDLCYRLVADSRARYEVNLVRPGADGEEPSPRVPLTPSPRLYHLCATSRSRELVEELRKGLREVIKRKVGEAAGNGAAALLSAALDLEAELADDHATFGPLDRFRGKLFLLDRETNPKVDRTAEGIAEQRESVRRLIEDTRPFPDPLPGNDKVQAWKAGQKTVERETVFHLLVRRRKGEGSPQKQSDVLNINGKDHPDAFEIDEAFNHTDFALYKKAIQLDPGTPVTLRPGTVPMQLYA